MKKQEKIKNLKDEIKKLSNELKETKEILKIVLQNGLKWKNRYKEIKRHYDNLINEKQTFINTKPEKIINVEIKGDMIFNPNNSFYKSDFLDDLNIFGTNNEIKESNKKDESERSDKKNVLFKKSELTKKEISLCKKYEKINEESEESSSLLQELDVDSQGLDSNYNISLQRISNNSSNNLINLYEDDETVIKKKRKRRKKY